MPGIGEVMFGTNIADDIYSGDYLDAGLNLGAYAALNKGMEFIGKGFNKAKPITSDIRSAVAPYGQNDRYMLFSDYPDVNILRSEKPSLDVENYFNRHKNRIIDKFGQDRYD